MVIPLLDNANLPTGLFVEWVNIHTFQHDSKKHNRRNNIMEHFLVNPSINIIHFDHENQISDQASVHISCNDKSLLVTCSIKLLAKLHKTCPMHL